MPGWLRPGLATQPLQCLRVAGLLVVFIVDKKSVMLVNAFLIFS